MEYPQESHTWTIRDQATIQRLNAATPSDAVDSITFEMHGMKWFLRLRPNGLANHQHLGHAFLILHLTGLPPRRSAINFRYKLCLMESNTIYKQSATFKSDYMNISWDKGLLSTDKIRQLSQFTLSVSIELLAVYDDSGADIMSQLYQYHDEYDDINREQEQHRQQQHQQQHHNKFKTLSLRRIKSSSSKRAPKLQLNLRAAKSNSNLMEHAHRDRVYSHSPAPTAASSYGSYDVVAYHTRLDQIEREMTQLNQVIGSLNKSIESIEHKLSQQYKEDVFDVSNDQYAMLMMEVNLMKRQLQSVRDRKEVPSNDSRLSGGGAGGGAHTVRQWLTHTVGLPQYAQLFIDNEIVDLDTVRRLSKAELKDMRVHKVGHQIKLLREIAALNHHNMNHHNDTINGAGYAYAQVSSARAKRTTRRTQSNADNALIVYNQSSSSSPSPSPAPKAAAAPKRKSLMNLFKRNAALSDTDILQQVLLSPNPLREQHVYQRIQNDLELVEADNDDEAMTDSDELYQSPHDLDQEEEGHFEDSHETLQTLG